MGKVLTAPELKFVMMKSSKLSEKDSSAGGQGFRCHQGKRDPPEGLPLVGVEIHGGLFQPRVEPLQSGLDGDHHETDAEHHMCDHDRPETGIDTEVEEQRQQRGAEHDFRCRHGRKISRLVEDRPLNRCRTDANAIIDPMIVANSVARNPIWMLFQSDWQTSGAPQGFFQASRVNPRQTRLDRPASLNEKMTV